MDERLGPFVIVADGPDGRVDHFYADTDLMELRVVPEAEVERLREEGLSTFEALQEQGAQVERLREALRPFARLDYDIGDEWRDVCEAARRALGDTA